MEADYAASFGTSKVMHGIRDGWRYDNIANALTTCGIKGSFTVNHRTGGPMTITCRNCERTKA